MFISGDGLAKGRAARRALKAARVTARARWGGPRDREAPGPSPVRAVRGSPASTACRATSAGVMNSGPMSTSNPRSASLQGGQVGRRRGRQDSRVDGARLPACGAPARAGHCVKQVQGLCLLWFWSCIFQDMHGEAWRAARGWQAQGWSLKLSPKREVRQHTRRDKGTGQGDLPSQWLPPAAAARLHRPGQAQVQASSPAGHNPGPSTPTPRPGCPLTPSP